jgi:hypothetical protein
VEAAAPSGSISSTGNFVSTASGFLTEAEFVLPSLTPLNLAVLTEEPSTGNGAGRLLRDELERILVGFSGILDVVGNGLSALEIQSRPKESSKVTNADFDPTNARENGEVLHDRLDSLTSSFTTTGGTLVRRNWYSKWKSTEGLISGIAESVDRLLIL